MTLLLKVASAMLGQNIKDHIHLIFPHDPLAARPISRASKKPSLCRQPMLRDRTQNKWYCRPLKTKINNNPTNHRQGVGIVLFRAAFIIVFTGFTKHRKEGRADSVCLGSRFK